MKILNGNELIVQGAKEAGVSFYTGYPGSPLADFFNILYREKDELQKEGIRVAIANSEANAAAMISGAKQAGVDSIIAMKSMGLHVASDALSVGNFASPGYEKDDGHGNMIYPGVVVVVGDDPWSMSTSTPADSRYLYKHLHIPFLTPTNPQELKDYIKIALELSKKTSVYHGVLLTTSLAEGGGRVSLSDIPKVNRRVSNICSKDFDLSKNVMVPPNSLMADKRMIEKRFSKVEGELAKLELDTVVGNRCSNIGVVSFGSTYETIKEYLEDNSLFQHCSLYKLASIYPIVESKLVSYLKNLDHVLIVEEKRDFLEAEIRNIIQKEGLKTKVHGKSIFGKEVEPGFPSDGGINFEIVEKICGKFFGIVADLKFKNVEPVSLISKNPRRLPTFCPGCPHRETLSVVKEIRKILESKGLDLISHGDVGCYSLSFLPPFKEMHNLSAMGQGGALGAGFDTFSKNPSIVLMGDSTFFHSGITDISNSVQLGHDITYILLDNENTAMTGHQLTPRSGQSVEGRVRPIQDMKKMAESIGVEQAIEINPSDRYFYKNLLEDFVQKKGVKVIISKKECGLTFQSKVKKKERKILSKGEALKKKTFYQINPMACEDCRICVEETGCPGLSLTDTAYGKKVYIDPQICVGDSYCTKIEKCPSFEKVDAYGHHPTKYKKNLFSKMDWSNLPDPDYKINFDQIAGGRKLKIVITGVGGSGVTTISKVLSHAASNMGGRDDIDFKFFDQKGLAQRNGNVTGHMTFFSRGTSAGTSVATGRADILLSPDLLDVSNQISYLSKSGSLICNSDYQVPLSLMLDNQNEYFDFSKKSLKEKIRKRIGEDRANILPLSDISNYYFGKSVYISSMLLGVAFQKGLFPFVKEDFYTAFENSLPKNEVENNIMAFGLGRAIFKFGVDHLSFSIKSTNPSEGLILKSFLDSLLPWQNKKFFKDLYQRNLQKLKEYFPKIKENYLSNFLHDILVYDRGAKLEIFMKDAGLIKTYCSSDQIQLEALRVLTKTYFIKDEVFVSHLMISPIRKMQDDLNYEDISKSIKKTFINRPSFDVFGKKIEFNLSPRRWMLKLMRHCRILRALLPRWHQKEKNIANQVRKALLNVIQDDSKDQMQEILNLSLIKGYRDVRYEKSSIVLGKI